MLDLSAQLAVFLVCQIMCKLNFAMKIYCLKPSHKLPSRICKWTRNMYDLSMYNMIVGTWVFVKSRQWAKVYYLLFFLARKIHYEKTNNNNTYNFNHYLNTFWVKSLTEGELTSIYVYIFPICIWYLSVGKTNRRTLNLGEVKKNLWSLNKHTISPLMFFSLL